MPLDWRDSGSLRLRRIQILDEEYFVSSLPVDDLIDQLLRQQDSEAARAQSKFVADRGVPNGIVVGIGHGCM